MLTGFRMHLWARLNFQRIRKCEKNEKLQPATLLKVTLLHGCFSRFLNCTNGTKSCNVPQLNIISHCDFLTMIKYCWIMLELNRWNWIEAVSFFTKNGKIISFKCLHVKKMSNEKRVANFDWVLYSRVNTPKYYPRT